MNKSIVSTALLLTTTLLFSTACTEFRETGRFAEASQCGGTVDDLSVIAAADSNQVIVEGIITANFAHPDQLGGFFMHVAADDDGTGNNDGRDGLSVFVESDAWRQDADVVPTIARGDRVRLTGYTEPYQGGVAIQKIGALTTCSANDDGLPAPTVVSLTTADDLAAHMHQVVRIETPLVVTGNYNLHRYGQLQLATERLWTPTQRVAPGEEAQAMALANRSKRIVLDDGSSQEYPETVIYPTPELRMDNPVRNGDVVNDLVGVVVAERDQFVIHAIEAPRFTTNNPRPLAPQPPAGDVRVVAFNVLNYFNGDGTGQDFPTPRGADSYDEFKQQRDKIVAAMVAMNADVFALMEMENDGFGSNSAIADLTRALRAAMREAELPDDYVFVQPNIRQLGGDAITQAIIYRRDTVNAVGTAAYNDQGAFARGSRPPLAQTFVVNNTDKVFTLVANHFKSKGGCPDDDSDPNANQGDGQACWNAARVQASQQLIEWLKTNPTGYGINTAILAGDFNAYAKEQPLQVLANEGFENLANRFAEDGYSYVFRGERGSLDHVLAHNNLRRAVVGMQYWHINADEPLAFQYPAWNKTEAQRDAWYQPSAFRSSDHDPIIVDLELNRLPSDERHARMRVNAQ